MTVAPAAVELFLQRVREPFAVLVAAGDDRDLRLAVADDEVGEDLRLQVVGRCRAEVEATVVIGRELQTACSTASTAPPALPVILSITASVTPEAAAPTMTSTLSAQQVVGRGAGDVRVGAVVLLDEHDILAVHATGRVDLLDGHLDRTDHRWAEEGQRSRSTGAASRP